MEGVVDGTGLGLPISYGLIRRYGGNITAESTLREGSIFSVWCSFSRSRCWLRMKRPLPNRKCAYLMVDQAYGMSIRRYLENEQVPQAQRIAYYFGIALPTVSFWYMGTALGALLRAAIPPQLSLEFAVPLHFYCHPAPMLRGIPSTIAAVVAVTTALVCHSLPYNLGLMVATFTGMGCGV